MRAGIEVVIPDGQDIELVNSVIYDELCLGIVSEQSKKQYLRIIEHMAAKGAQGVILGCTEIGLLINQEDTLISVFDTTKIHATRAAMLAIG